MLLSGCEPREKTELKAAEYGFRDAALDGEDLDEGKPVELQGSTVTVATDKKTATVKLADGTAVELKLELLPDEQWESGCHTNLSSISEQTFKVSPAKFEAGPASFEAAKLTADCGGHVVLFDPSPKGDELRYEPPAGE